MKNITLVMLFDFILFMQRITFLFINSMLERARHLRKCITLKLGVLVTTGVFATSVIAADLVVNISDSGFDPAIAGQQISYTIRISNNGNSDASAVNADITLPISVAFVSATGAGVTCAAPIGTALNCDVGLLNGVGGGASERIISLLVQTTVDDILTLAVSATALEADTNDSNNLNQTEQTTVLNGADVELTILGAATVQSGQSYSYSYTLTNHGPGVATEQRITAPIPSSFSLDTLPSACSSSGSNIICDIAGPIANGGTVAVASIVGTVTAAGSSTLTASANVALTPGASGSALADPLVINNSATLNTSVSSGTDMAISIARDVSGQRLVGSSFNFIVSPSYSGESPNAITVLASIPIEYNINALAANQNGWSCGLSGQNVSCSRASGSSAGVDVSLGEISIPVSVVSAGNAVVTSAQISSASAPADNDLLNNNDDDGGVNLVASSVDLTIDKRSPTPALTVIGVPFNYSILVANAGSASYSGDLRIIDTVPAGLTYNGVTTANGWSCGSGPIVGPTVIECTRANTAVAAGRRAGTLVLNFTATQPGVIANSAQIIADTCNVSNCNGGDVDTVNVSSSVAAASTDIAIIKTVDLNSISVGEVLTYTLEITNDQNLANNVVISDDLTDLINNGKGATDAGFISVTFNDNGSGAVFDSCSDRALNNRRRRVTCTIAQLPVCSVGNCPTLSVQVRPRNTTASLRNRSNTANAISNSIADTDLSNNSSSISSAVEPRADVSVEITQSPDPAVAGQNLTYIISVKNNGLSAAELVDIQQTLPDDVIFVSATPANGSCPVQPVAGTTISGGSDHIDCDIGSLAAGAQTTITVVVRPRSETNGTNLTIAATTSTTTPENNNSPNSATAAVSVTDPIIDLFLEITEDVDPVAVGDDVIYTFSVLNNGPSASQATELILVLPNDGRVSYQSINANGAACTGMPPVDDASGATVSCLIGYMEDNQSHEINVTMSGAAKGTTTLNADIQSTETLAGFELSPSNNTGNENTTVRTKADIEVLLKQAQSLTGTPISIIGLREPFQFLIQLVNNTGAGLGEADSVQLIDSLPAGMELTGTPVAAITNGSSTLNSCSGLAGQTNVVCDFGTVSAGATIDVILPVKMVVASAAQTTNTASVVTTSLDIAPSNNSAIGTIPANGIDTSSISGTVYLDSNADGSINTNEGGVAGVIIELSGIGIDGEPVLATVVTGIDGNYSFSDLPQSNGNGYTIIQKIVADPDLIDGVETAGSGGGDTSVNDQITVILSQDNDITGYLFAELPIARIGIAKQASVPQSTSDGRFSVEYRLLVENAGSSVLSSVQISDELFDFGSYTNSVLPTVGEYTISTAPFIVSASNGANLTVNTAFTGESSNNNLLDSTVSVLPNIDVAATSTINESSVAVIGFTVEFYPTVVRYENAASVSGKDVNDAVINDDSVDGANVDPNANDDPTDDSSPTVISLSAQEVSVDKALTSVVQTSSASYELNYTVSIVNPSNTVAASHIQVVDSLQAAFPNAAAVNLITAPQISNCTGTVLLPNINFDGVGQNNLLIDDQNLLALEHCDIQFTVAVDFGSTDLLPSSQTNLVVATSSTPDGLVLATDNGTDEIRFDNLASVAGEVWRDANHNETNDGEAGISGFLVEVLNAEGSIIAAATTDNNGGYVIEGLFPSTVGDATTQYIIQFRDPASGAIYGSPITDDPDDPNGVVVGGQIKSLPLFAGTNTSNQSLPLDPAGVIYDSITRLPIAGAEVTITGPVGFDPAVHLVGGVGNAIQTTGSEGVYQFLLLPGAPDGDYSLQVQSPAGYLPDESTVIPACTNVLAVGSAPVPSLLVQNSNDAPDISTAIHDANNCPADSSALAANNAETQYYLAFTLIDGVSVEVLNNHIPLDAVNDDVLTLSKSAAKINIKRGEIIPYTIVAKNNVAAQLSNINLVDRLPAGFKYVDNSATLDGIDAKTACNELHIDKTLECIDVIFEPDEKRTLKLLLVAGAGVSEGEYINYAWAENSIINASISNTAKAKVNVVPDPIFDCSDVIGKVYDDKNYDGYQNKGEEALPNVRLATARGLLVTTDEHGRYHISCAAVPNSDRGSNFIVKVDERSLPSGYRITTENPRVVRLTRGKIEEADFGAAIHRVVRLDVNSSIYQPESSDLAAGYESHLNELLAQLVSAPSVLRIGYISQHESKRLVKQRIKSLRKAILNKWDDQGCCYRLLIEHEITPAPLKK